MVPETFVTLLQLLWAFPEKIPEPQDLTPIPWGIPRGWPSLAVTKNLDCGLVIREHVSHLGHHSTTHSEGLKYL